MTSSLLTWSFLPSLGHSTQAATPAPPQPLTNVEGVGGLLLPQLQVQDIRCLRVMAEPQGHSQDDASGQLGRKQREARVTHCSSHIGPRLALFSQEHQTCFSSPCKYTRASFLTIIPPLQHALCPIDHEPCDRPCFMRRLLILGCAKPFSVLARDFFPKGYFIMLLKWKAPPYPSKRCATKVFRRTFQLNLGAAPIIPFSQRVTHYFISL